MRGLVVWIVRITVATLACTANAATNLDEFEYELMDLGQERLLLGFMSNSDNESIVLLLDSGVEVPVVSKMASSRLGMAVIYKSGDQEKKLGAIKKLGLNLDLSSHKFVTQKWLHNGPALVREMPIFKKANFEGMFPPYLIYLGKCKIIDMLERTLRITDNEYCLEKLSNQSSVKFSEIRSNPKSWLRRHKLTLNHENVSYDFLVDTGSTLTYLDTSLNLASSQTSNLISYFKTDGVTKLTQRLKSKCVSHGKTKVFMKDLVSIPVEEEYQASGVVGSDFLSLGLLYYLADGTGFFRFRDDADDPRCST